MKKKWIAIFLAITAGSWGVHRFYLRQPELGITYVALWLLFNSFLFISIPISSLLGFWDAYKFMMMDDGEFDRRYNNRFFRDRYGNRKQETYTQRSRKGRYILMDEDAQTTIDNKRKYFELSKRKKESESYKQSGIKKFKDYDLKGSIEDFEKALELNPEDKAVHFNIACAYSLNENALKAFVHLDTARGLGFQETERILTHEALSYLRVLDEFEEFKNNNYRLNQDIILKLQKRQENILEQTNRERAERIKLPNESILYR